MYNPNKPIDSMKDCLDFIDFLKYLVMHCDDGSPMRKAIHDFTTGMQTQNMIRYRGC
jgi:hypothetical protein